MSSTKEEVQKLFASFNSSILTAKNSKPTPTKEQIIERVLESEPANELICKEPCVLYLLGSDYNDQWIAVSSDPDTVIIYDAWFALIRKIAEKHHYAYDFSDGNFYRLRKDLIHSFKARREYFRLMKKQVDENDADFASGAKSFQNSSHLQDAVKDLKHLLATSKKLYDLEMVTTCENKIHALQAG